MGFHNPEAVQYVIEERERNEEVEGEMDDSFYWTLEHLKKQGLAGDMDKETYQELRKRGKLEEQGLQEEAPQDQEDVIKVHRPNKDK